MARARSAAGALPFVVALALAWGAATADAYYWPTGEPVLAVGQTVVIYSDYYKSFCYWENYDPNMIYDRSYIKCNAGKDTLELATRFRITPAMPLEVCGRIPMSTHNVSVGFNTRRCLPDRPLAPCEVSTMLGGAQTIKCDSGPVYQNYANFMLKNSALPSGGVDGWLHGGQVPITIMSARTGKVCGVNNNQGMIECGGTHSALASTFYFVPTDPLPGC
jgi:hypothetical protein